MRPRLAIVGAGPKAAAIVARAAALRESAPRLQVPDLLVFENVGVAAAWSGQGNFSSGFLTLCTPGEKDVGFPYDELETLDDALEPIGPYLFERYSWSRYLVGTGRFGNWVDRDRDHPTHALFAKYINWVFQQAEQDVIPARVERIWRAGDKWCIDYVRLGSNRQVVVDGVVLTGAGTPTAIEIAGTVPRRRVFDSETFWPNREIFMRRRHIEVAVAGDGGSAGAIVGWLADRFAETKSRIWSVSPMGTLFPRGDGHAERRWFSFPQDWPDLSVKHRRKLIERTEAGVVSMRNKRLIDRSDRIEYKTGKVKSVALDAENKLAMQVEYDTKRTEPLTADYLISAIGFDKWSRLSLIDVPAARTLVGPRTEANATDLDLAREITELTMGPDLSLPEGSVAFPPGLHVPALADLRWGPGMSNLGCLGLMAARVLKPYIK